VYVQDSSSDGVTSTLPLTPPMFLFWEVMDTCSADTWTLLSQFFQIWGLWVSIMQAQNYLLSS